MLDLVRSLSQIIFSRLSIILKLSFRRYKHLQHIINLILILYWVSLDSKILHQKTTHRISGHMHGVLNNREIWICTIKKSQS